MSNKEPGYVYILTNPGFREDWVKIGKISRIFFIGTFMPEDQRNASGAYQGQNTSHITERCWMR